MKARQIAGFLLAAGAVAALHPRPARAGKADAVDRLVADGKLDAAQTRCERWEAWDPGEEEEVREACAEAFWPAAERLDTQAAWEDFRAQWTGTHASARARSREAEAALRAVPSGAGEALLMDLAGAYRGTPTAETFEAMAADAAIRDARTAKAALEAARRWAGHPDLPVLVERFPEAFLTVTVTGRQVQWTLDPPVEIPTPQAQWVARRPDGSTTPWDLEAASLLIDWGVPDTVVGALPTSTDQPALPVCWVPDRPAGWRPGVQLKVGEGGLFQPVGWDEGCGPDTFPVFLSLEAGRAVGVSLRPGHLVDLRATALTDGRRTTRAYVRDPLGTPLLWNGWVHQRAGGAWLITPLSGGQPWLSVRGPDATAAPLTAGLRGAKLPGEWTVDTRARPPRVTGAALAKMPEALQDWPLVPGEVRSPPPLVREVLGLTPDHARPQRAPAPALPPTGWTRTGTGAVTRTPPSGGTPAGLYQLEPEELAAALQAAQAVGLTADRVTVIDGWRSDLDGDTITERILRAEVDGAGAVLLVDPLREDLANPSQSRVFVLEAPRVKADARPADTPFTFRKGKYTYLAWAGQEVLGPEARRTFVEVVRADGASFVVDDLTLE